MSFSAITSCNSQIALLDYDGTEPYYDLVSDDRITATSYMSLYPPSEARMSGDGWCAQSMCTVGSESQYLQVDFGAEVVVEAIAIGHVDTFYVTKYYVEYGSDLSLLQCVAPAEVSEDSRGNVFDGFDICRQGTDADVKSFVLPIIARFIRVVPLEWEGPSPCLKLELYGCLVKECSQIRAVSNNNTLLPVENIIFSSYLSPSYMDISSGWCALGRDLSPNANLTFTEPLYLLYAVVRGDVPDYVSGFSFIYANSSGERVTYMTVDRTLRFGLESVADETFLLWTPINTSKLQLRVDEYSTSYSCIGVDFYGCTYNEVINHVIDDVIPSNETVTEDPTPTSCVIRPVEQQTSVTTVTTTVQPPATTVTKSISLIITSTTTRISFITITATPQSSCSNSGQQQTSSSSSSTSDSNAVTICVPIVVVFGVITVIVLVVTIILIWRRMKSKNEALPYNKVTPNATIAVENDLYGMESIGNESLKNNSGTSDSSVQADRKDSVNYEYPTTIIKPNQPTNMYESVSVDHHEEDASETTSKTNSNSNETFANPVYCEASNPHGDLQLQPNPSYIVYSETTD